jgi:RNA-splicing ligase RtcB
MQSISSLGSGNHYIECNQDDEGNLYLVIHSGSRNLGKQTAEYYQDLAYEVLNSTREEAQQLVNKLKQEGREKEIGEALKGIKKEKIRKELAYLEGKNFDNYIHDMKLVQQYATLNREAIVDVIIRAMNKVGQPMTVVEKFTTIHNYIDTDTMILRKGAISAKLGEKVLIPMNMRDGSLICEGLGNKDWNTSAPHGAGRIMSRSKAKSELKLEDFQSTMKDVYSTTVNRSTLDEAPMAYKPMEEIISNIGETVKILKRIKPLYNFKASE